MAKLAVNGGAPVQAKNEGWAKWPVSTAADAKLMAEVVRSNRWSYNGPIEWKFAQAFTQYQKAKFGLCVANGTVSLQMSLEALGIGAYDEVLVPGMTWQATAAACVDVNAIPRLVDVEPDTWNLDLDKLEAAITPRTKAVIVVHLYGAVTDITRLVNICKKHKLALIEDCAHQHGTFWKGQGVGSFGDCGSFSFQESKVLSSGEGGFITAKNKDVFYKLDSLRNCGRPYEASPLVYGLTKPAGMETTLQSGNYRITEFQAVMLLGGLDRLDKQVKLRDANGIYLNSLLAGIPGILPLRRRKEVTQQSYFNFAFRIDPKELGVTNTQFCGALNAELGTGDAFEPPYEPLNHCGLYKPLSKNRHKLGKDYYKAINPALNKIPACIDANQKSGVCVHHVLLMNKKKDMDTVAEAVRKIVDNIGELRGKAVGKGRKYAALSR